LVKPARRERERERERRRGERGRVGEGDRYRNKALSDVQQEQGEFVDF
jgi:hypothetical protein